MTEIPANEEEFVRELRKAFGSVSDPTDPALIAGALLKAGLVDEDAAARIFRAPGPNEILTAQQVLDCYDSSPLGVFNGITDPDTGDLAHGSAVVLISVPNNEFIIRSIGCCRTLLDVISIDAKALWDFSDALYAFTHPWQKVDLADEETWPDPDASVLIHRTGTTSAVQGYTVMKSARVGIETWWKSEPVPPTFDGVELGRDG